VGPCFSTREQPRLCSMKRMCCHSDKGKEGCGVGGAEHRGWRTMTEEELGGGPSQRQGPVVTRMEECGMLGVIGFVFLGC
jgi:hypothetical protein